MCVHMYNVYVMCVYIYIYIYIYEDRPARGPAQDRFNYYD